MRVCPTLHAHQGLLEVQLHHLFPLHNIIRNARKEVAIKNTNNNGYLEVDYWVPQLDLCFEFQDDYHYNTAWYSNTSLSYVQQKDDRKRNHLIAQGQSLVSIPYWWDGTSLSLQGTIHFYRPDLQLNISVEIPINPPSLFYAGQKQLMFASFPDASVDVLESSSWWVGEKWDGIRCFWDVAENRLYSRHNVAVDLHPSVSAQLGYLVLDGEIWCGRGAFHECQNYAVGSWERPNNAFLRIMCFDEASSYAQAQSFEDRYALLLANLPVSHPLAVVTFRFLWETRKDLNGYLRSIIETGGEGIILQQPISPYIPGRSHSLLKLKGTYSDQEALVVKVEADGSLVLQLPNGFTFVVAKENCVVPQLPVRGNIVSLCFDHSKRVHHPIVPTSIQGIDIGIATGVPSKPVVYRIRADLSWEDVVHNSASDVGKKTMQKRFEVLRPYKISSHSERPSDSPNATWKSTNARRAYFDGFAASKGMDPLNASFWYSVTTKQLSKYSKACHAILKRYGGKLSTVLKQLYPDIGLQKKLFNAKTTSWKHENARRALFDSFAASKRMDPLSATFWYSVTRQELKKYNKEGFSTIFSLYGNKLSTILMRLYPNLGLQRHCFKDATLDKSWKRERDRRAFFEDYAISEGMDARNPIFWYSVTPQQLTNFHNGYQGIVKYHSGKLSTALLQLFPDIGLQESLFEVRAAAQSWKLKSDRRDFFDNFAASRGSDPLDPNFWYTVATKELESFHIGYRTISQYYDGKLSTILMDLYPDIGLQKSCFKVQSWLLEKDRRAFFNGFAASKGEDPLNPDFWYGVTTMDLRQYHSGYNTIAQYHEGKLSTALTQLYPDIGLQKYKIKANHCATESGRRQLFCDIAEDYGFDPLVPDNWYSIANISLQNIKAVESLVANYYSGSISRALMDIFPDIGLVKENFGEGKRILQNERGHLESVAKRHGFDSLQPDDWSVFVGSPTPSSYARHKLTEHFLNKYTTTAEALLTVFPEMTKDATKYPLLNSKFKFAQKRMVN